jgi:hypothetical protein
MAKRKSIWVLFGIFVISVWVLGLATQAGAETMKAKICSYITQVEVLPVGDQPEHFYILNVRRGLVFFETGDVALYTNYGISDALQGKGPSDGYTIWTFEDGSTIVAKPQGTFWPGPKKLSEFKGTAELIKGTGRFEGIKGSLSFSGKQLTPYSKETKADFSIEAVVNYTLPSK